MPGPLQGIDPDTFNTYSRSNTVIVVRVLNRLYIDIFHTDHSIEYQSTAQPTRPNDAIFTPVTLS